MLFVDNNGVNHEILTKSSTYPKTNEELFNTLINLYDKIYSHIDGNKQAAYYTGQLSQTDLQVLENIRKRVQEVFGTEIREKLPNQEYITFTKIQNPQKQSALMQMQRGPNEASIPLHIHPGNIRVFLCQEGSGTFYVLPDQQKTKPTYIPITAGTILAYRCPHTFSSGREGMLETGYHKDFNIENILHAKNTIPHLITGQERYPPHQEKLENK